MSTAAEVLRSLQAYNLKDNGGGKYTCNSPFRPGSDSGAFSLTIHNDEHGAYFDFVSQESGSLYDLARKLNIAVADRQPVASTKRLYAGLDDYAKAHGIPGDVLRKAGWTETMYNKRRALHFTTKNGSRWRFLDDGNPRYISSQGFKRCWYGLNDECRCLLAQGFPLVLCNGEISTIAAQYRGIAAACVAGGENILEDHHVAELRAFLHEAGVSPPVIIAMDCDHKGTHIARGILTQLQLIGFDVRALDLGLGTGGDLADFCMLHEDNASAALAHCAPLPPEQQPAPRHYWKIIDLQELMNAPEMRWLIKPIIPETGLVMIYGASGSYKSFFALDMALDLSHQHSVIYVAAEGESGYKRRVSAWRKHRNCPGGAIRFCMGAVNMFDGDELLYFQESISKYSPKLVIVDTLQMCIGAANENDGRDMKRIVDGCKALGRDLGCAVVLVHHTNKEGVYERGWGGLRNSADTLIKLNREDEIVRVSCEKTKDEAPFRAYYLAPLPVQLGLDDDGEPVQSLVLVPSDQIIADDSAPLTDSQITIMQAIETEATITIRGIAQAYGLNPNTVQRTVKRMQDAGYLEYDGSQRHITETGQRKLSVSLYRDTGGDTAHNGKYASPAVSGDTGDTAIQTRMPGVNTATHYDRH